MDVRFIDQMRNEVLEGWQHREARVLLYVLRESRLLWSMGRSRQTADSQSGIFLHVDDAGRLASDEGDHVHSDALAHELQEVRVVLRIKKERRGAQPAATTSRARLARSASRGVRHGWGIFLFLEEGDHRNYREE